MRVRQSTSTRASSLFCLVLIYELLIKDLAHGTFASSLMAKRQQCGETGFVRSFREK